MTAPQGSSRWLSISIAFVLALAVGAIIWGARSVHHRQRELGELTLQHMQQLMQVRLNGFFHELEEDLREESAASHAKDSSLLAERWFPLLDTHWPILAIRMADEFGNEISATRSDTVYLVTRVAEGSKSGPPIRVAYSTGPEHAVVKGPWLHQRDLDPRERVWFSKALEDTRNEPIWTLRSTDSSSTPRLQVSYMIRNDIPQEPYRILQFTVDIGRSAWLDPRRTDELQPRLMVMDDLGRSLLAMDTIGTPGMGDVVNTTIRTWLKDKTTGPFPVRWLNADLLAQVGTYTLHGQQLNMGVLIDPSAMDGWLAAESQALIIASVLMAMLIILLAWAWIRNRSSDERIRKQAKRSRSQELKLAKALGEREVLNREVHHRVKNNLQVVSSLLNLQATRLDEGLVRNEFLRGKRRIDTIALVHHKLYGLPDLRNVDLNRFFNDMVNALADLHAPQSRSVSHEVDTDGIKADQDTAIELGIILCELVANTYQHAFPYATGGHVEIRIRGVEGDLYRLTVKDNGRGIPEGGQTGAGKLGLEIVEALSEQLDGSFHMLTNSGVHFEVLFRMQRTPVVPADQLQHAAS